MLIWVIMFLVNCSWWHMHAQDHNTTFLDLAYNHYKAGETTTFATIRDKEFNAALSLYLKGEKSNSSGKLYYNIANCYFQLGETPIAIFYYERALLQIPRSSPCLYNLSCAQLKAGLSVEDRWEPLWVDRMWPVAYRLSLLEIEKGYLFCIVGWFVTSVLWNITKNGQLTVSRRYLALIAFFCVLFIVYSNFWAPFEGVMLPSAGLHTDEGKQYALIRPRPVLAGTKVKIYKVSSDRKWYLVGLGSSEEGYVPVENVRLLR